MKRLGFIFIVFTLILAFSFSAKCENEAESIREGVEESFFSSLDKDTRDILSDFGITSFEGGDIVDGSFSAIKEYFGVTFKEKLKDALSFFFLCLGALMLLSLATGLFDFSGGGDMLSLISTLILTVLFSERLAALISACVSAVNLSGKFILAFIPAFALLITLSGSPASALTYNTAVLGFCEAISAFLNYGLVKLSGAYFALLIGFSLNPVINISRFINAVNRFFNLALGFTTSMFVGFLSIKNVFSFGADSLASRGTRFLLSSLVPVIGPSLSEAYSAFLGSINLLKGSFGVLGIAAITVINTPILIEGVIYHFMLSALSCIAEVLTLQKAGEVLRGFSSAVKILLLLTLLEGFVFILSAGIMMTIKKA